MARDFGILTEVAANPNISEKKDLPASVIGERVASVAENPASEISMSVAVSIGFMLTRLFFIEASYCHQFAKLSKTIFIYLPHHLKHFPENPANIRVCGAFIYFKIFAPAMSINEFSRLAVPPLHVFCVVVVRDSTAGMICPSLSVNLIHSSAASSTR